MQPWVSGYLQRRVSSGRSVRAPIHSSIFPEQHFSGAVPRQRDQFSFFPVGPCSIARPREALCRACLIVPPYWAQLGHVRMGCLSPSSLCSLSRQLAPELSSPTSRQGPSHTAARGPNTLLGSNMPSAPLQEMAANPGRSRQLLPGSLLRQAVSLPLFWVVVHCPEPPRHHRLPSGDLSASSTAAASGPSARCLVAPPSSPSALCHCRLLVPLCRCPSAPLHGPAANRNASPACAPIPVSDSSAALRSQF
ncbi:hypothetical protein NDU88_004231 [Pleurodeles waltl]|uniref:Uncharacterized protein n=1 Tax=Pleurodeles waltl TaxID=8319 RepID=A0AAV7VGG3_PLEWA|nr:hypothetical protein NDU88_004231 [Pleurodeles waltl]